MMHFKNNVVVAASLAANSWTGNKFEQTISQFIVTSFENDALIPGMTDVSIVEVSH